MGTNLDTSEYSREKLAMLYSFKRERSGVRRVIDENWFKKFITPAHSGQSVLQIFDENGREILSIERNDS